MKHVCVIGGGAALAQPVIRHYLDAGDTVTAVYRQTPPALTHSRLHRLASVDLGRREQAVRLAGIQPIDVLITMTGAVRNGRLDPRMKGEDWDAVLRDTLTSVANALAGAHGNLAEPSNVVVVGSIVGSTGGYGCSNYAAAKAGLVGLVRSFALENASRGIVANVLELGYVEAGMGSTLDPRTRERAMEVIPLKRFATEAEVVDAVAFLGRVRYMTGNVLLLAGGMK